jgi:RpiR family carbohydrate utilization transcriptional regulator
MKQQKSLFQLIEGFYEKLSKTEKRVADYVFMYPDKTIISSLQAVAEKCMVSDASVLRFCRSLGFSGYQDFKAALVPELLKKGVSLYQEIDLNDDFDELKKKYLQNLAKDIKKTMDRCTENTVDMVATKLCQAEHILIVGLAGSAGVARIFNDCLLGLGILSTYISDRVEIERMVSRSGNRDLILGISHSGETQEIVHAIKRGKENEVFTIGITNFASSRVAKLADLVLLTMVPETPLGSYSCQPRIAELALLEFITLEISSILKKGGDILRRKTGKGGDKSRKN